MTPQKQPTAEQLERITARFEEMKTSMQRHLAPALEQLAKGVATAMPVINVGMIKTVGVLADKAEAWKRDEQKP